MQKQQRVNERRFKIEAPLFEVPLPQEEAVHHAMISVLGSACVFTYRRAADGIEDVVGRASSGVKHAFVPFLVACLAACVCRFKVVRRVASSEVKRAWAPFLVACLVTAITVAACDSRATYSHEYVSHGWLSHFNCHYHAYATIPQPVVQYMLSNTAAQSQYRALYARVLRDHHDEAELKRWNDREERLESKWKMEREEEERRVRFAQKESERKVREAERQEALRRELKAFSDFLYTTCSADQILRVNETSITVSHAGYPSIETYTGQLAIAKKLRAHVLYSRNADVLAYAYLGDGTKLPVGRLTPSMLPAIAAAGVCQATSVPRLIRVLPV